MTEFLFRVLFCIIFIGLGAEHLFKDDLIRMLMPAWVPWPRFVSAACGLWLVFWGSFILLGWHLKWSAIALGAFVVSVTTLVHAPALLSYPPPCRRVACGCGISFSAAISSRICVCSGSVFIFSITSRTS